MLAERISRVSPRTGRLLATVLALGLGFAAAVGGSVPTAAVAASPVQVVIAVPIVVPPNQAGLISAQSLAQYTSLQSPEGLLTRQLDAVIDRPVAIAIDPMIIVSIRVLGTAAPPSATAWLERLSSASNDIFPLAYGDADLTLITQAGGEPVASPTSFDFALDADNFAPVPDEAQTPTPAPTADPIEPQLPAYPTTEDLLAWPYSTTDLAWPREGTVIASDLPTLADAGYGTTVLSSANVARTGSASSMADIDGRRVLVSDLLVSAALRDAADAVTDDEWTAAISGLSAAIATAGQAQPVIFVTASRSILASSRLGETIAALDADPLVSLVDLPVAVGASAAGASVLDQPQDAQRVAVASALLDAEHLERRFATVASDPLTITAPRALEIAALLSNGWEANPDGWTRGTTTFFEESTALRGSVQIVTSDTPINLLADRAGLPIAVSNDLDVPVTVYITVRPSTGLLSVVDPRVELVIEPHSQGKGAVPVEAISNGVVQVAVSLTSSTGVAIGAGATSDINVQAGWETPVVVIITIVVILVFSGGIIRNVVRRRRAAND